MKYVFALVSLFALLFSGACTQSPEKLLATANKYHQNKRYKEASILYQKVIAKDKTNAEAYYRQGLNLLDDHQPFQAAGFLRRAIDLKPDNMDASLKLAEVYLAAYTADPKKFRSVFNDARDLSAKVSARSPGTYEALRLEGLVSLSDKDTGKALEAFQKANQLKPHSRDLVGWYAQTLVSTQHGDQAIALVQDMLAQDKTWTPGYDFLFVQYSRGRDMAKAEGVLRSRVANDPSAAGAYMNLANYLQATSRASEAEPLVRKLLDDKKTFPNANQMVGDFYVRTRKYDQALQLYKQGLAENPKHPIPYQERIVAVQQLTGHYDEALKLAKEVATKNPKDATANEVYASLLLQRGTREDLIKSVAELKNLVQKNPNDAVLHLDLAKGYYGLKDVGGALAETLEALQKNPNLTQAHVLAAKIYSDRGDHGKAIEQAEMVLTREPANAEAGFLHARSLIASGRVDRGVPELETLLTRYPNMNDARVQLAAVFMQQKAMDKAKDQFSKVWASDPPDFRGFVGLQTIKMAQGQVEDAVQAMQDQVQKNPKNDALRSQLANFEATAAGVLAKSNAARSKELATAAVGELKDIVKRSPKAEDVWIRLGVLQRELKENEAAMASFDQAIAINPRSGSGYLNRAVLLDSMGRKKEAAEAYNRVLGIDPQNTLALNNLAFLNAVARTNLDQAMTLATRAQKQVPNSPDVSDTLGYVYYQKNLNEEALQIFRKVVQDYPQNPTFRFHLAMALLKQGDKRAARDEAQKALKNAPPQQVDEIRNFVGQIG